MINYNSIKVIKNGLFLANKYEFGGIISITRHNLE